MRSIKVSVIVPIYNAQPFLRQALTSLAKQNLSEMQVICINDGSTDNSLDIIKEFVEQDSRFVVIDKENEGYGATCNKGLLAATGDYVSVFEPDDWIEGQMFNELLEFAESFGSSQRIDVIKSAYTRIVNPDTPQQKRYNCSYKNRKLPKKQPYTIDKHAHLISHHPSIWTALYNREFLLENNIKFREYQGSGWADNPFLIETLCRAKNIIYMDKAFYCYREETDDKANNFSRANSTLPLERWLLMLDLIEEIGIADEGILKAHYSRGFTYLSGVLQACEFDDDLRDITGKMFDRMDSDIVLSDATVPNDMKRMFIKMRGLENVKFKKLPYIYSLAEQFFYSVSNNGPGFAFSLVSRFAEKVSRRSE